MPVESSSPVCPSCVPTVSSPGAWPGRPRANIAHKAAVGHGAQGSAARFSCSGRAWKGSPTLGLACRRPLLRSTWSNAVVPLGICGRGLHVGSARRVGWARLWASQRSAMASSRSDGYNGEGGYWKPMIDAFMPQLRAKIARLSPLGRLGTVQDIGNIVSLPGRRPCLVHHRPDHQRRRRHDDGVRVWVGVPSLGSGWAGGWGVAVSRQR